MKWFLKKKKELHFESVSFFLIFVPENQWWLKAMTKNLVEDKKINKFFNYLFEPFAGRSLPNPVLKNTKKKSRFK